MTIPNPDYLLDQAEALLLRTQGGPHRQANLRRPISTAYYAVFHAILAAAADRVIGRGCRSARHYALVYRSIDHRALNGLCQLLAQTALPPKYREFIPDGGFGDDIRHFSLDVRELQQERHLAVYDPAPRIEPSKAAALTRVARASISRWERLSGDQKEAFLLILMFSPR